MKRLLGFTAILVLAACSTTKDKLYENPFYAKYLNTGSPVDADITRTLEGLRANPKSPSLHNDLGQLLVEKGFPKDAEREFERSVNADSEFYPAWYNLGLVRAAHDDEAGARRAFSQTVRHKPGHAAALFQLGLIEERMGNRERAVDLYAKAYSINRRLLEVQVNPRIVDSKLTHLAMLQMYDKMQSRQSMSFNPNPAGYVDPSTPAPSPQPAPASIVTPAPPATEQGTQKTTPQP